MSKIKNWLEDLSEQLGYHGEINEQVISVAQSQLDAVETEEWIKATVEEQ